MRQAHEREKSSHGGVLNPGKNTSISGPDMYVEWESCRVLDRVPRAGSSVEHEAILHRRVGVPHDLRNRAPSGKLCWQAPAVYDKRLLSGIPMKTSGTHEQKI